MTTTRLKVSAIINPMLLITAATDDEMRPLLQLTGALPNVLSLVTGIGCMEAAVNLCRLLSENHENPIQAVINFGIAGAFLGNGVNLLDICMAESEIVGDLGVCLENRIVDFDTVPASSRYQMDPELLHKGCQVLRDKKMPFYTGNFVSVNCVTGTSVRGNMLRDRFSAICENMEGAAIARVCSEFDLPCLELRCISNMVEDRDLSSWQIAKAIETGSRSASLIIKSLAASCS